MTDPATGFLWFLAFLFSTTVHEAMHAWAAMKGGDLTAYHGGQVSLSPIPHIQREPIGMLVLPLLTAMTQGWAIGWASAPYDPYWAARYPKRAAVMAAAGPIGNLILAAIAFTLLKVGLNAGWFVAPASVSFSGVVESTAGGAPEFVAALLSIFLMLNVLLFAFNLLPLPPLDGSAVLGLVLPQSQAIQLQQFTRSRGSRFSASRSRGRPSRSSAGRCLPWCWRCCTRGRAIVRDGRRRTKEEGYFFGYFANIFWMASSITFRRFAASFSRLIFALACARQIARRSSTTSTTSEPCSTTLVYVVCPP